MAKSSRATLSSCGLTLAPSWAKPAWARSSSSSKRSCRPLAHHHVLEQRDRADLLHDRGGVAADLGQPLAELLGVGDGRAERDHRHALREVDDDLLPDRAAHPVGEVVHLVHHDVPEAHERAGPGVQHVAEHLGGHHHDRRLAVDGVVTGEQADVLGAVALDQVLELLVAQRLDRGGVEALAAGLHGQVHGELADDGLAGAGGGGDEHAAALLDLVTGPDLEVVEGEVVEPGEAREHRVLLAAAEVGVLLAGGAHAGSPAKRERSEWFVGVFMRSPLGHRGRRRW